VQVQVYELRHRSGLVQSLVIRHLAGGDCGKPAISVTQVGA
jgi:hypothetical protein